MPDNSPRLLDVLVATYDNPADAETDLKAVKDLYQMLGTSYNFDAAVISKTPKGKIKIDKTYEAGRRHDALKGLGFGLAAGIIAAIFPPLGIAMALAVGGIGGAAIGGIVGHIHSGVARDDLRKIADRLEASRSALIVVYETSLADQIAKNLKALNRTIVKIADLKAEQLAEEIREAREFELLTR